MLSPISGLGHGHLDVHSNRKVIKTPMFRELSGITDSSEQPCRKGLTRTGNSKKFNVCVNRILSTNPRQGGIIQRTRWPKKVVFFNYKGNENLLKFINIQ